MRSKLVLTAAVALLASGGLGAGLYLTGQQPDAPSSAADPAETAALAASKGLAVRQNGKLVLRLQSGEALALTDRARCGEVACPPGLAQDFRFQGWDAALGGYRLSVNGQPRLLPYGDDPALVDPEHADPPSDGPMDQPAAPPPQSSADDSVSEWLAEIAKSRDDDEAKPLAAAGGKALRKGADLILTLADGKHLALSDDLSCGQVSCPPPLFRSFAYAGISPDQRFHLVEERWDEGQTLLLIDAEQGNSTEILGLPLFSPSGKLAAAALKDLSDPQGKRLELWDLSTATPRLAFQQSMAEGDATLFSLDGWSGETLLKLKRGSGKADPKPVRLALVNGAWQLLNGN